MLLSVHIQNYTLVESLDVEFNAGMTAITGETGAGKSLVLDALGMAIGDRADSDRIRHGAGRAEIAANFDTGNSPEAREWLLEHDFPDTGECLIRRIFTREGRSRGYINGSPATMQQLQGLGELLLDIHSQHEHQSLLRPANHRKLLDAYANHPALLDATSKCFINWRQLQSRLDQLSEQRGDLDARRDLLSFQTQELDELNLQEGEVESLEQEQKLLSHAEEILLNSQHIMNICSEDESFNLQSAIHRAVQLLANMPSKPETLLEAEELLQSAQIQVAEAGRSIQQHVDTFDVDPARLQEVESRLNRVYELARKHRCDPDRLPELHQQLSDELSSLGGDGYDIEQLTAQCHEAREAYLAQATKLSQARAKTAKSLCKHVNSHLAELSMAQARFSIELAAREENKYQRDGIDQVEFLISTNQGQPSRPLAKIASGGELSRISLAIQVVTAQTTAVPCMIFDEVDVGIGGATADVVGKLLRQLSANSQIICVTHQPQVASRAHHHLRISKYSEAGSTESKLELLAGDQRVEEIARMLGGMTVTDKTRHHAMEMLEIATN